MNIRELAKRAKLSRSTVSLALRDNVGISEATRSRVKALAARLGYKPDPTVAKIMGAIARRTSATITAPLILLSDWETSKVWDKNVGLRRFYRGLSARATELGYRLDELWIRSSGMSPRRVEQILAARGIQGIVVLNYPEAPAKLPLDLTPYATVVIGRALVQPRLYAVDHDHHQGLFECLKQISARGYRRPGLVLKTDSHERTMHCWAAAYQFFLSHLPARQRIPFLLIAPADHKPLAKWMATYKPDVVISADSSTLELISKLGFKVPDDVGLAALFWREDAVQVAGIDTQDEAQGARAIDVLVDQIARNQHGMPHKPETILFDGFWRDGTSLPILQKSGRMA